jgi:hypothetical protein
MRDLAIKLAVCAVLTIVALTGLEIYLRLSILPSSGESIYEYALQTKRSTSEHRKARRAADPSGEATAAKPQ